MRVLLLPGDRGGCGLYRMIMPGRAVANAYPDVEIFVAEGLRGKSTRDRNGKVTVHSIPPLDADVVVFQRPLNDDLAACIPLVQKQGVAVVVELDDDFRKVHPRNVSAAAVSPGTSPRSNWEHLLKSTAIADMVTVSTQRLTNYADHDRVRVVRNYLPQSILTLPRYVRETGSPVRLGWTGTVATHPQDLTVTRGAVGDVMADTGAVLRTVGGIAGVGEELMLRPGQKPEGSGWVEIQHYPEAVRDHIDVGMVPLMDTPFNHAKSSLKGMEFAALGIPFVASPTAEYLRLADKGAGLIARGRKEWYKHLTRLVRDDAYRAELAEQGREVIRREFTIEQHVHEWYDAWQQALANRDARMGMEMAHAAVG